MRRSPDSKLSATSYMDSRLWKEPPSSDASISDTFSASHSGQSPFSWLSSAVFALSHLSSKQLGQHCMIGSGQASQKVCHGSSFPPQTKSCTLQFYAAETSRAIVAMK